METREKVRELVFGFFATECDVPSDELTDDSRVIEDLAGDSLMFLELLESIKKDFRIDFELKTVGKYLSTNSVDTLGEMTQFVCKLIDSNGDINAKS